MNVQNLINKFKNNKFLHNNSGSVTIEFISMLILLLFMLVFMADLAILRSNMGKLDNLSYSLVNVLRERTQLHREDDKKVEHLTNNELEQFKKLAKGMFFGNPNTDAELYIVLEALQFNSSEPEAQPEIKGATYTGNPPKLTNDPANIKGDIQKCRPTTNLVDVANIAPRSELDNKRTLPLYQVTICIPSNSLFKAITAGEASSGRMLRSSSIAVGR